MANAATTGMIDPQYGQTPPVLIANGERIRRSDWDLKCTWIMCAHDPSWTSPRIETLRIKEKEWEIIRKIEIKTNKAGRLFFIVNHELHTKDELHNMMVAGYFNGDSPVRI